MWPLLMFPNAISSVQFYCLINEAPITMIAFESHLWSSLYFKRKRPSILAFAILRATEKTKAVSSQTCMDNLGVYASVRHSAYIIVVEVNHFAL